ncbi:MAG: TlpA family protein disulfide reductase [Phycisphaerales bacterium]|nr:TlpA family protein disulfide reductase [Phycisphaerales bacterium]
MPRAHWAARLVVGSMLAMTVAATAQDKPPERPSDTPTPGTPTPAKPAKGSPRLVPGMAAPALSVESWISDSEPKLDADGRLPTGNIAIVSFWAVWAPQATSSLPRLAELAREFAGKPVSVIAVTSADKRNNTLERVQKFLAEHEGDGDGGLRGLMLAWDRERATSTAWLDAAEAPFIPWTFVVDQQGKIAFAGNPHEYDSGSVVDRLLAGTWDIAKGPGELDDINKRYDQLLASVERRASTEPQAVLAELKAFESAHPRPARGLVFAAIKAEAMIRAGDAGAYPFATPVVNRLIALEGRSVQGTNRRSATYLNQIAWAIVDPKATSGDKEKDLSLALKAAEAANAQSKEREPAVIDTLARVWWLKNDKMKAVELQKKAVRIAGEKEGDDALRKELEQTLRFYQGIGG